MKWLKWLKIYSGGKKVNLEKTVGCQETSQKEKKKEKVKYKLVKMLIKVTTRKTEIKHVTLKLGGGEKKNWYQANKKKTPQQIENIINIKNNLKW